MGLVGNLNNNDGTGFTGIAFASKRPDFVTPH
jgi:hypothetical protein